MTEAYHANSTGGASWDDVGAAAAPAQPIGYASVAHWRPCSSPRQDKAVDATG
jgi:hypothetical protein